jgi:predicted ATP-grasp superfamily ATP-dependent carboligase
MPQNNPWLIVAQSGRALAVSAARAGFTTYVIDRFGDMDTRAAAHQSKVVECDKDFDINKLTGIIEDYSDIRFAGVVTGSGLENHPAVLDFIKQHWPLYGNDAETVRACKDPVRFFKLLDKLSIPHPRVRAGIHVGKDEWLVKFAGGAGGNHISRYTDGDELPAGCYLQEKISGRTLSVVFLADGRNCRIVGYNEIWPAAPEKDDYRYSGAMTLPAIGNELAVELGDITSTLVKSLELKGLCGMDVIVDDRNQCRVLEINPRPVATFELHERHNSLFEAHILACQGKLPQLPEAGKACFAHKMVHAVEDFIMPEFAWPAWTTDRPAPGTLIRMNSPVCTIHAQATDIRNIHQQLDTRTQALQQLMPRHKLAA